MPKQQIWGIALTAFGGAFVTIGTALLSFFDKDNNN